MSKQPQFSVSMPARDFHRLNRLAQADGRSRSQYVKRVIDRHLREVDRKGR